MDFIEWKSNPTMLLAPDFVLQAELKTPQYFSLDLH